MLSSPQKKGQNNALVLGQPSSLDSGESDSGIRNKKLIYFNSVGFNGNQFLTDSAIDAGYTSEPIKPDASVIETGLASMVAQDVPKMIVDAENALLRILVNDSSSRTIVKNMLTARLAVNFGGDIHWSCPEHQWLFEVLIGELDTGLGVHSDRHHLRTLLAHRPDAPPGAFSNDFTDVITQPVTLLPNDASVGSQCKSSENVLDVEPLDYDVGSADASVVVAMDPDVRSAPLATTSSTVATSSPGSLDAFFADELTSLDTADDAAILGTRNTLAVQETLISLLLASASFKSQLIREKLASYEVAPGKESALSVGEKTKNADTNGSSLNSTLSAIATDDSESSSLHRLDVTQWDLLKQLQETTRSLQSLQESSSRIRSRLMDESASNGIEGSISRALQVELASQLDDFVRTTWQQFPPPGVHDVPYETELERMAAEWGEWYEDDYVWSPGEHAAASERNPPSWMVAQEAADDTADRESLEEFNARIHRDWGDWVD